MHEEDGEPDAVWPGCAGLALGVTRWGLGLTRWAWGARVGGRG